MTIWNSPSGGEGSVTGFSFTNCTTDSDSCSVEIIEAAGLPWPAHLGKVTSSNYIVIKGIQFEVVYAGDECVLNELLVEFMGNAGGLIDNSTETVTFSPSTFGATGTKLLALGVGVELNGVFAMAATGAHSGQSLAVL